jgi:hypothetical protein
MTTIESVQRSGSIVRTFRRLMRPAVLALLNALPSPQGCGCKARKEWLIRQIEAI